MIECRRPHPTGRRRSEYGSMQPLGFVQFEAFF